MRMSARFGALLGIALSVAAGAYAQSGVKVEVDEVIDNRVDAGQLVGLQSLFSDDRNAL